MNQFTRADATLSSRPAPDRRLHYGYALLAAGVLFAPFLIDAGHAGPASDDFCYAAQNDKTGFLGSIAHYYDNVNGRFFATFLILSLDRLFPIEHAYLAVPVFFFASIVLSLFALFWAIAPRPADWRLGVALSLLSALVLVTNTEAIAEVFYWLSASATYVSATAGTLIALACMLALTRADTNHINRLAAAGIGALAALAAVGSFEAAGPVLIAGGVFCMLVARILERPGIMGIALVAAGAAAGLWLNLSSPGTAARAAVIALDAGKDTIELIVIALRSILWTTEHLATWGSRASVWFVAFALFWTFRDAFPAEWTTDTRRRRALCAGFAGLAALPYLAAFPMFYAYRVPYPIRAQFFVDAFCMIFWLAVLAFAFHTFRRAVPIDGARIDRRLISIGLFAACFVTIAGTVNFYQAGLDTLRGFAFAKQAAAQIHDVAAHPNRSREVVLTRSQSAYAPTLAVSDLTPDPRRWRNVCFAEFVGAYGVRVEPKEDIESKRRKSWYDVMPRGWVDPDPQAIGRPRPAWPGE